MIYIILTLEKGPQVCDGNVLDRRGKSQCPHQRGDWHAWPQKHSPPQELTLSEMSTLISLEAQPGPKDPLFTQDQQTKAAELPLLRFLLPKVAIWGSQMDPFRKRYGH